MYKMIEVRSVVAAVPRRHMWVNERLRHVSECAPHRSSCLDSPIGLCHDHIFYDLPQVFANITTPPTKEIRATIDYERSFVSAFISFVGRRYRSSAIVE